MMGNTCRLPDRAPTAVSSTMGNPLIADVSDRRPPLRRRTGPSRWCCRRANSQDIGAAPPSSLTARCAALAWSKSTTWPKSSTILGVYPGSGLKIVLRRRDLATFRIGTLHRLGRGRLSLGEGDAHRPAAAESLFQDN